MPHTLEELAIATAKEQSAINELQNIRQIRDPVSMMKHVPAAGQGCVLIPQTDPAAVHLDYPYPQHIPSAAAAAVVARPPPLTPTPIELHVESQLQLERYLHGFFERK